MTTIYFDMDGTIANLYAVENWLARLRNEDATPYMEATPMCDMEHLSDLLNQARAQGYAVGVISWLSKEATHEYKWAVTRAKKLWLKKYLGVEIDEAHFIQYGTRKDYVAKDKHGIIFDDDGRVRAKWRGQAHNPTEVNIIEVLQNMLE